MGLFPSHKDVSRFVNKMVAMDSSNYSKPDDWEKANALGNTIRDK